MKECRPKPGDNEPKDKNDLERMYCKKCDKWLNDPASFDRYKYWSGQGFEEYWTVCRTCGTKKDHSSPTGGENFVICIFCKKKVRISGEKEPKTNMERQIPYMNTDTEVNHDCQSKCRDCGKEVKQTNQTLGLLNERGTVWCITCRIKKLEGTEETKEKEILDKLKKINPSPNDNPQDNPNGPNNPNPNPNNPTPNSDNLSLLNQINAYFSANSIKSITKQPNGDLLIKFENDNPEQTINETNNDQMDQEQKEMWSKFKEWMKKREPN